MCRWSRIANIYIHFGFVRKKAHSKRKINKRILCFVSDFFSIFKINCVYLNWCDNYICKRQFLKSELDFWVIKKRYNNFENKNFAKDKLTDFHGRRILVNILLMRFYVWVFCYSIYSNIFDQFKWNSASVEYGMWYWNCEKARSVFLLFLLLIVGHSTTATIKKFIVSLIISRITVITNNINKHIKQQNEKSTTILVFV